MTRRMKKQQLACQYCDGPVFALNMCAKHYQRFRKHGDPHHVIRPRKRKESSEFVEPVKNNEVTHRKNNRPFSSKRIYSSNSVATIVRYVDELGRIVLPREYGTTQGINPYDPLEFFVSDHKIILKKYQPGCLFCRGMLNLTNFKGKLICLECASETANLTFE